MCADLYREHLERFDAEIREMVGEWLGIHGIPVPYFKCLGGIMASLSSLFETGITLL
jgi:hypothetical protein